ncbi:uncharacterized protein LOC130719009 [Lotus japonicus]|uniref:uncharacterized protein LOC130719009 n=1 Tax=Lotus japonicus TaxID=34305 RepID=UPI00258DD466|nr:uncharacterized protein LOC130719009 [Lotus japonicus]
MHDDGGSPFAAEAMTLREGLQLAWNKGYRKVSVGIDYEELVSLANDSNGDIIRVHPQASIIRDIKLLLGLDWRVELSWIPCDANAAAHWLAKQGAHSSLPGLQLVTNVAPELEWLIFKDALIVP